MSPREEIQISIKFPADLYSAMLELAHQNKLINLKLKDGEDPQPDSLVKLVRLACAEKYLKKKGK